MSQQLLPMPTVAGKVNGIVSLDPPTLQCGDCGLIFTTQSERTGRHYSPSVTVILSGCERWGFCGCARSGGPKVRRCGDCDTSHRATHPDAWQRRT